jgi:thiosulfate/3-mercaptopyruvate sulfurtransferase
MAENKSALVSPEWLEQHLGDPAVRIIALNSTGRGSYDGGHIPGAVYWEWKDMLWDPLTRNFPSPEDFARRCGEAGIRNDSCVVCYGDPAVQFGTYAWWVFKYCGHKDVRLLDGAKTRWVKEGRPLTTETPKFPAVTYQPNAAPATQSMRAMRNNVAAAMHEAGTVILDHRSPEEYRGERYGPPGSPDHGAERLGHIPGARHLHFEELIAEDTSFKPPEQLRAMFEARGATPDKKIISYCRLSHRATLAYFVMTQLLGYPEVRSYDGSWTEWGSLVGAPVERSPG